MMMLVDVVRGAGAKDGRLGRHDEARLAEQLCFLRLNEAHDVRRILCDELRKTRVERSIVLAVEAQKRGILGRT